MKSGRILKFKNGETWKIVSVKNDIINVIPYGITQQYYLTIPIEWSKSFIKQNLF